MLNSKYTAFLGSAVLLVGAFLLVLHSVPLGLGVLIIALSWLWYKRHFVPGISHVEFYKLHEVPQYTEEVSALVTSEWPVPLTAEGIEEANFVRTSSLKESRDTLPCHLLALASSNGEKQVVAHCVLKEMSFSRSPDLNKFRKMLKMGLSFPAVQQYMEVAGLDPSLLNKKDSEELELSQTPSPNTIHNITLSALVVKPEFRGRGLGKGMCAYAVQVASGLGVKEVIGGCRNELVPFYQKLGVKKRSAEKRDRIPKVRLGNEMFVALDDDIREQAAKLLSMSTVN
ncbi:uncharacterized protein LOC144631836 [Oculina patagonica]